MIAFAETVLPAINASLNAIAATCITFGWRAILRKDVARHRNFMVAAMSASALFLACYLTRAALTGTHRFEGPLAWRVGYLVLLFSHMTLAVATVPLVARTAFLGFKRRVEEHRRIARWTLPVWLYVSVTGVIIYVMLYHVSGHVGPATPTPAG